jgi:hypothetical protein
MSNPRRRSPPSPALQRPPEDPSTVSDGASDPYRLDFDEELKVEFRWHGRDQQSLVHFRILTSEAKGVVQSVKFEILDDADVYSVLSATYNAAMFEALKSATNLFVDLAGFPREVELLLKDSLRPTSEITVVFWQEDDGSGILEFNQLLGLKVVEIFKIAFPVADPNFVSQQVQYRYEKLRFELARKKRMLEKFRQEMQLRNPIIYRQIDNRQRSPRTK